MRACAKGLNDFPYGSGSDEVAGVDGALDMKALAVVNGIFLASGLASATRLLELVESGEGRLVREIIFPSVHDPATKRAAFIRHGSGSNKPDLGIIEDFFQRARRACLGELFLERPHFICIRIENPLELRSSLYQAIALTINVAVVEVGSGYEKLARLADWRRFPYRGVGHSIGTHRLFLADGF